jgi:hypothetical protein
MFIQNIINLFSIHIMIVYENAFGTMANPEPKLCVTST